MKRRFLSCLMILLAVCLVSAAALAAGSLTAAEISAIITSYQSPTGEHYGEPLPAWLQAYMRGETVEIPEGTTEAAVEDVPQPTAAPVAGGQVAVQSTMPTVYAFSLGDTTLSGAGVSGARIEVVWPDGSTSADTVASGGKWSFATKGVIAAGGAISIVQTESGKGPSTPVAFVMDASATGRPQVSIFSVGDEALMGYGVPGAQVDVVWPGQYGSSRAFADKQGAFRVAAPDGVGVVAGGTVSVTQTVLGRMPSSAFSINIEMPRSEKLTVNAISRGSTVLSGTGVTGATITVTWPGDIDDSYSTIQDGRWSVPVPAGLAAGNVVHINQVEPGKSVSERSSVVVGR